MKMKDFTKKHTKMLVYGFKHKLVFPYPDELFDALRPFLSEKRIERMEQAKKLMKLIMNML